MKLILNIFFILLASVCLAQTNKIDSLLHEISSSKEDSTKVKALLALSMAYRNDDPELSIKTANEALDMSRKNGDKRSEELCLLSKSHYYLFTGLYDSCIFYSKLVVSDSLTNKSTKNLGTGFNNMGSAYFRKGDYAQALSYYYRSIQAYEEAGFKKNCIMPFNNVGLIHIEQKLYTEALAVYRKMTTTCLATNENPGLTRAYNNIALIYARLEKHDSAIFYYQRSIDIAEKIGDDVMLAQALNNIAAEHRDKKNYDLATDCLERSLKIRTTMGDEQGQAQCLLNIGINYHDKKEFEKALVYLSQGMVIAKRLSIKNEICDIYKFMSVVEEAQHHYDISLKYFKLYKIYNDSMFNEQAFEKIAKLNSQNEMSKKDHEIQLREVEIKKQNTQRNAMIIGLILLVVLVLISYRGYRQKKKANLIIEEQKREVVEKQKEVMDSIHYAKKIQTALITNEKYIEKAINRLTTKL